MKSFSVSAGPAEKTLPQFIAQSGLQVAFSPESVKGATTRTIRGEHEPAVALEKLLAGTGLVAVADARPGAYAVRRDSVPNAPRAAAIPAPARPETATPSPEETLVLSPFTVTTDRDTGYAAASSLAGTRLNSELRNTPAAISVFTAEFIQDIGVTNVKDALAYALNGGNEQITDFTGNTTQFGDLRLQLRGFVGATLGRNYFSWGLSSDSYTTERLDFARGPNAVLFGIGAPGGVLNTTSKRARTGETQNRETVVLRVGSWDDYRATIDVNRTIGKNAAIRVNALWQDRESWREFEYTKRLGAALAATWRPFRQTELRFDGELGKVDQVGALPFPANDHVTPWLRAGSPLSTTFGQVVPGTVLNTSRLYVFDPTSGTAPSTLAGSVNTVAGLVSPSNSSNTRPVIDPGLLPRSAYLPGAGATTNNEFHTWSLFAEQQIGPLALEAAYNRQFDTRDINRPLLYSSDALRADPNARLPNGAVNPNAGRLYAEGQFNLALREATRDEYRLTAALVLDGTKKSPWLGRHTLAGLVSRRETASISDDFREVNVTPAGTANYPADLTNANNGILRRTYLDFSSSDPARRGVHDPLRYPIVAQGGVTAGIRRVQDNNRDELARLDSTMFALQSAFLDDRLWLTGGLRRDEQRLWASLPAARDPVTRAFLTRVRASTATEFSGETRTYGVVWRVLPQASLFFNSSNSLQPQSTFDILDRPIGPSQGEGRDYGLKFNLWDNRLAGTVTRYNTDQKKRAAARRGEIANAIRAIWEATGVPDPLRQGSQDTSDLVGKGWEFELIANPLPSLRLSANFSLTDIAQSNLSPQLDEYLALYRTQWTAAASRPLIAPFGAGIPALDPSTGRPPTIATAIGVIDSQIATLRLGEGQIPRAVSRHAANLFARWQLPNGGWSRGLAVGGGVNFRSAPVTGYDSTRANAPVYGAKSFLVNAMISYQRKLARDIRWRLQLNVDNALGEDSLIITDKDNTGTYRYFYQTPRRWAVSSTFEF